MDNVIYLGEAQTHQPQPTPNQLGNHAWGEILVTTLVTKYKKIRFETHENVGFGEVYLPPQELQTESYWVAFDGVLESVLKQRGLDLGSGLRALATALGSVAPLHAMCDPRDIRTVPMVRSPFVTQPTIFLYDYYPGGIGISQKIYQLHTQVWQSARALITECTCESGCPSCVGPALEVGLTGKNSALVLLEWMCREPVG